MKTRFLVTVLLAVVLLLGVIPVAWGADGPSTQGCLAIDGSSSIEDADWATMLDGFASAIENPNCVPHDGMMELTVVQFSDDATVEIPPVVITGANAASVASDIRNIEQQKGDTNTKEALDVCTRELVGSPNFGAAIFQAINLSTDGVPTVPEPDPKAAAIAARGAAIAAGIDEIDAEAIGTEVDAEWLRVNIVYPQPGHFVKVDGRIPGWVDEPANADELAAGVCAKFRLIPPEEFVPEPVSLVLFGGGLLGLAGYAGLRLRKR